MIQRFHVRPTPIVLHGRKIYKKYINVCYVFKSNHYDIEYPSRLKRRMQPLAVAVHPPLIKKTEAIEWHHFSAPPTPIRADEPLFNTLGHPS